MDFSRILDFILFYLYFFFHSRVKLCGANLKCACLINGVRLKEQFVWGLSFISLCYDVTVTASDCYVPLSTSLHFNTNLKSIMQIETLLALGNCSICIV